MNKESVVLNANGSMTGTVMQEDGEESTVTISSNEVDSIYLNAPLDFNIYQWAKWIGATHVGRTDFYRKTKLKIEVWNNTKKKWIPRNLPISVLTNTHCMAWLKDDWVEHYANIELCCTQLIVTANEDIFAGIIRTEVDMLKEALKYAIEREEEG